MHWLEARYWLADWVSGFSEYEGTEALSRSPMKKWLLITLAYLGLHGSAQAGDPGEMFNVYLVRHAEKSAEAENPADPPLSPCGELRAASLVTMLQSVSLDHVYSTPYDRTVGTARPVAESHDLELETYEPGQMEEFARRLLEQRENALVVGHSNTTGVLAGLLSGEAGEEFPEDDYDRLYLVTRYRDQGQVILLDQVFRCVK